MDKEKFKVKQERTINKIQSMIETIEIANTMRFIFDDKEMMHDFDMAGDIYKTMKKIKEALVLEFRSEIEGLRKTYEDKD